MLSALRVHECCKWNIVRVLLLVWLTQCSDFIEIFIAFEPIFHQRAWLLCQIQIIASINALLLRIMLLNSFLSNPVSELLYMKGSVYGMTIILRTSRVKYMYNVTANSANLSVQVQQTEFTVHNKYWKRWNVPLLHLQLLSQREKRVFIVEHALIQAWAHPYWASFCTCSDH